MNGHDHDLPPLPKDLVEEMAALRRAKPAEQLIERAFSALPPTPPPRQEPKANRASQSRPRLAWIGLALAPALAVAAIAVHHAEGPAPTSAIERIEERSVDLPEQGHAWTDIRLETHHHADKPTVVHVDIPENVRVRLPSGDGSEQEQHCEESRCVHRFTHRPGVPLRVAVTHPGRYEIHVRHESKKAHVKERFVLTALRD